VVQRAPSRNYSPLMPSSSPSAPVGNYVALAFDLKKRIHHHLHHPILTGGGNYSRSCVSLYWQTLRDNHHALTSILSSTRHYSRGTRHQYKNTNDDNDNKVSTDNSEESTDQDDKPKTLDYSTITSAVPPESKNINTPSMQSTYHSSTTITNKPSEPSIHNISYLPKSFHPYAHLSRFDKPIGTFLLLHPCLWSTALASPPGSTLPEYLGLCALFGVGSFVMRGAGCTINDMWDAKYDREVERTKSRPLACGILNYKQATAWLGVQLSVGLGVLLSLPHVESCFLWGVASLPLVATYPLMKRYTNYPQSVLGMTFNWGAIMGWVAVRGDVDWSVVGPLYLSGIAWTLVYDTLYAHQDKVDDAKLGLKSTALTFGDNTKPILSVLTAVTWACWMTAGYNCGYGIPLESPYYYTGCSLAAAHLLWQVQSADLNNTENLAYRFRSNNLVGWMMFGSCALGNYLAG